MEKGFKILLATDYSEAVMNAERYAVQFAYATGSSISIMHVFEIPIGSIPPEPREFGVVRNGLRKSELAGLEQHRNLLFRSLNLGNLESDCECIISEGSTATEVCRKAKELAVDFIIAGAHETGHKMNFLLSNHARGILKGSSVPVIIVPKDGMFTKIKNIVFAIEEREGEIPAINHITQLAKMFNAEISIFHSTNDSLSKQFELDAFENFVKEVKEKVPYDKMNFHLGHNDNIVDGLNEFCEKTKADWLVLSPKKRSLIDKLLVPETSFSKKISLHTNLTLVGVPDGYQSTLPAFFKSLAEHENPKNI